MPQITANNITLEYDEIGNAADPAFLLISGLGSQLIGWPQEFAENLAAQGFRVIRFDNRDIGLSQHFDEEGTPDMGQIMAGLKNGQKPVSPYMLDDMAADAAGLLDALGIDKAHIAGMSMGGMIAQLVAANHPEKCLSMNSIMSTSSRGSLPPGTPEATAVLTALPEDNSREGRARHKVKSKLITGSPGHQAPDDVLYDEMLADIDRSYHPEGQQRQYVAIMASGSRTWLLPKITVPTMVLHGDIDPLVPREAGIDTAELIPGSEYVEVEGMGHDIAPGLYDTIMGHMARHAKSHAA